MRRFVDYAKRTLNEKQYYPPSRGYRYIVALGLYSKAITVAEAGIVLLEAGFSDEAFGLTRTLVDIFFTLRYIANTDTDARAQRYCEFVSKDTESWVEVAKLYWPGLAQSLDERTKKIAAQFRSPHSWSGHQVKDIALEPDTVETDPATGNPLVHDFAYKVIYRWTSHYVHPTVTALFNHIVQAGSDPFVVRSRKGKDMHHLAAFNVAVYLVNTMICFYRCMGDPQPERLGTWAGALMKHLTRRHD